MNSIPLAPRQTTRSLALLIIGWPLMVVCGALVGWGVSDMSDRFMWPAFLWLMALVAAVAVGVSMEKLTTQGHHRKAYLIWFGSAFLAVVLALLTLFLPKPVIDASIEQGFRHVQSSMLFAVLGMIGLVLCIGAMERILYHDERPSHPHRMTCWSSMAMSGFVVGLVALCGWNASIVYQGSPNSVWGWWNTRQGVLQAFEQNKITPLQLHEQLSQLEDRRAVLAVFGGIQERLMPPTAYITRETWCDINRVRLNVNRHAVCDALTYDQPSNVMSKQQDYLSRIGFVDREIMRVQNQSLSSVEKASRSEALSPDPHKAPPVDQTQNKG